MTKIEKIKDFIQSFFYYRKLVKWYESEDLLKLEIWGSALKYALWHCKIGKLKPDDEVDDSYDEWHKDDWLKPIYRQEPIEIPELEKLENGNLTSSGIYIPHHEGI